MTNDAKCIILVGYMCAGKTTVGKALAKKMGRTFYDLDWYIEERFHSKVPKIFAEQGEERFRDLERRMLHEVAEFENVVISCGGGTPCFYDNMEYMNRQGMTLYLKASPEVLAAHLRMGRTVRPLIVGKNDEELRQFIMESLEKREPYYSKAKYMMNVDLMDNNEKIQESIEKTKEVLGL